MALGQIGQNAAEEFFEELTYLTAYSEAREQIQNFTKDVDNNILAEALESAGNVLAMGIIMLMIQKQEQYIEKIFNYVYSIVGALVVSSRTKILNRLRRFRGVKLLKRMSFFKNNDNIDVAGIAVNLGRMNVSGTGVTNTSLDKVNASINMQNSLLTKEKLHLDLGEKMASRYNQTLLFKLFTKNFTQNDKVILKRILGREATGDLDVDEINEVANFMFVKDSQGNPIGLTEAFVDLLNGLGYINK